MEGIGIIVFMAGVCANNNWRKNFLDQMEQLGVDRGVFFDPVLPPGVDWDEKIHKPAEDRALEQADYVIVYLGNTYAVADIGNTLPAYSINEAHRYLQTRKTKTIVICDYKDLTGHPLKQLKAIASDLRTLYGPDYVFDDIEKANRFFARAVAAIIQRRVALLTAQLQRIVLPAE